MPVTIGGGLSFRGRELAPEELDLIRRITREFSTLARTELPTPFASCCSGAGPTVA